MESVNQILAPLERRLYVGAALRMAGWEVYLDTPHEDADHVGPYDELRGIADESVSILYIAALGRVDFAAQALPTLQAWWRALRPGGALLVTVPNVTTIGAILGGKPTFDEQVTLTQLLAAQRSLWTAELLGTMLEVVGFTNVRQAETFNLFNDTSALKLGGRSLALNVLADKK